jgi:2-oxoglutarate dehydrogenase E1 component
MNPTVATRWNQGAIETAYEQWRRDPNAVDATWRAFFEGFELAQQRGPTPEDTEATAQTRVVRLIAAYREIGHFQAHLDPLSPPPPPHPQLRLDFFGLSEADLDKKFDASAFSGLGTVTLRELQEILGETYCRTIGFEFSHLQDIAVRRWLREHIESRRGRPNRTREQKLRILRNLLYAELFEKFLHTRFQGQKRFSLEGAETLIPLLDTLVQKSPEHGIQEYVIGMAHRGRLNVLANILRKPYQFIFAEFEDFFLDDIGDGDGDVKYHLGFSSTVHVRGHDLHLSLTPNPSHLESVDPVVEGRVRAKQELFADAERRRGVPLLIHGDAAFPGQGQVAETFNMARLDGYTTGGTVHVVINNQIGFTTAPSDARSTAYCTEVAKVVQAPIFHVNADDPEAVAFVAELALAFRQEFHTDVVIDLVCYRKHGHNEGDEPSFTQPVMYEKIRKHPPASQVYTDQLVRDGELTEAEAGRIRDEFQAKLDAAQADMKNSPRRRRGMNPFEARWKGFTSRYSHEKVPTGVPFETLKRIAESITHTPEGFTPNPGIVRAVLHRQQTMLANREPIDWGLAEALSFGSLLLNKTPIRLSGQDSRRGTFSQRHAVLVDYKTGGNFTPLNHVDPEQARLQVYNSPLSEYAVLGFEFGYSLDDPYSLVLWEAQFGDFANGAQVIIDQYIASSESKWQRTSGLVLLLPHGYEGQGPEHSSARLERFLQLCAEDNLQVTYPTTPAQYFHMLRRQMKRPFRKPLVVMTPKSLLRHPLARSPWDDLTTGHFGEVLDDPNADPGKVRRLLLCSGKVYYDFLYDAKAEPDKRPRTVPPEVAIVRMEQLYPFPEEQLKAVIRRYPRVREWVWVQEEPQNMGAWTFIEPRLRALDLMVDYVGRDASASPATGSYKIHDREQKEIVETALTGSVPHLVKAHPDAVYKKLPLAEIEAGTKVPAMSQTG